MHLTLFTPFLYVSLSLSLLFAHCSFFSLFTLHTLGYLSLLVPFHINKYCPYDWSSSWQVGTWPVECRDVAQTLWPSMNIYIYIENRKICVEYADTGSLLGRLVHGKSTVSSSPSTLLYIQPHIRVIFLPPLFIYALRFLFHIYLFSFWTRDAI